MLARKQISESTITTSTGKTIKVFSAEFVFLLLEKLPPEERTRFFDKLERYRRQILKVNEEELIRHFIKWIDFVGNPRKPDVERLVRGLQIGLWTAAGKKRG